MPEVAPLREKYEALVAKPGEIEAVLRDGALPQNGRRQRSLRLRERWAADLSTTGAAGSPNRGEEGRGAAGVQTIPRGRRQKFHFKLVQGERVLLQSAGFDSPRDAGSASRWLRAARQVGDDPEVAARRRREAGTTFNAALAAAAPRRRGGEIVNDVPGCRRWR